MKYSDALKLFYENAHISFTGKFNLVRRSDKSFIGCFTMKDGIFVAARFLNFKGVRALKEYFLCLLEDEAKSYQIISEPEEIDYEPDVFALSVQELKLKIEKILKQMSRYKKLFPRDQMYLIGLKEALTYSKIDQDELDILILLAEYSRVKDIVLNSKLTKVEVYIHLCKLKEKNCIKVLKVS